MNNNFELLLRHLKQNDKLISKKLIDFKLLNIYLDVKK